MALIVYEGFDHYSDVANVLTRSGRLQWTAQNNCSLATGRVDGKSLLVTGVGSSQNSPGLVIGALDQNYSEFYIGQALLIPPQSSQLSGLPATNSFSIHFKDLSSGGVGTTQFRLFFDAGAAMVQAYDKTGTLVGTLINCFPINSWFYIEVHGIISNSTGKIELRINGQVLMSVSCQTQSSAHSYINGLEYIVALGTNSSTPGSQGVYLDDWYLSDTTVGPGPFPYNTYMGDVRVSTLFPTSDGDTISWTPGGQAATTASGVDGGSAVGGQANTIVFAKIIGPGNAALTSLGAHLQSSITGSIKAALYSDNNGVPGTLLATSSTLVNPSSGLAAFPVSGGPIIVEGNTYWVGVISSVAFNYIDIVANIPLAGGVQSIAFASAFPSNASATLANLGMYASMTVTGPRSANWAGVADVAPDGDTTYNGTATNGNEDLFHFSALSATINNVLALQVTGSYRKSDAGTHIVHHHVKTGGTDYAGSTDLFPAGSYVFLTDLWVNNPNTSNLWTTTDINGLQSGPELVS